MTSKNRDMDGRRYVTPVGPEAESHPGSRGRVLRNLQGIIVHWRPSSRMPLDGDRPEPVLPKHAPPRRQRTHVHCGECGDAHPPYQAKTDCFVSVPPYQDTTI